MTDSTVTSNLEPSKADTETESPEATDLQSLEAETEVTEIKKIPPWVKRAILYFWLSGLAVFYLADVLRVLKEILVVLIVALFLSFAIEPAVNLLERRGVKRYLGTGIVFLLGLIVITSVTTAVGAVLVKETTQIIEQLSESITNEAADSGESQGVLANFTKKIENWIAGFGINVDLNEMFDKARQSLVSMENLQNIFGATTSAAKLLVFILSGSLFTFYLVSDGPKLRRTVLSSLNPRHAAIIMNVWDLAIEKTGGYIYSRAALSLISAVFHWIAFAILGMPSPLTLALWVGIVSQFIPAVGTYIAGIVPVLLAFIEGPKTGLFVLIVVVLYQQVENYLFAPRITARTMKLHVAVAFGSVIVGVTLLGIVGAFLALPFAATSQAWFSSWNTARKEQLNGKPTEPELKDEPDEEDLEDTGEPTENEDSG